MFDPTVHALQWFEIPATDLDRAQGFYEQVLGLPLRREGEGDGAMVLLPFGGEGVGGCLAVAHGEQSPGAGGTVVYLPTPCLDEALARVAQAGGRVRVPKTCLPDDWGYCAHITDTEGNRVGLHSLA